MYFRKSTMDKLVRPSLFIGLDWTTGLGVFSFLDKFLYGFLKYLTAGDLSFFKTIIEFL